MTEEVFIVLADCWDGKGYEVIGVFASAKSADACCAKAMEEGSKYKRGRIEVWGVEL